MLKSFSFALIISFVAFAQEPPPLYREISPHLQTAAEVAELQYFVTQPGNVVGAIVVRFEPSSLTANAVTVPLPGGKSVTFAGTVQFGVGANARTLGWKTNGMLMDLEQYRDLSPHGWIWDGQTWHCVYWSRYAAVIFTPTKQYDAPK